MAAVAAWEEAEQRADELQAAAESASNAKSADAERVHMDASHCLCLSWVELYLTATLSLAPWCASGVGRRTPVEKADNVQAVVQELEQTGETETAPGGRNSGRGGAESDGEGADLQVFVSWQTAISAPVVLSDTMLQRWQTRHKTVSTPAKGSAHEGCAGLC